MQWGRYDGLGALIISPTRELAMQARAPPVALRCLQARLSSAGGCIWVAHYSGMRRKAGEKGGAACAVQIFDELRRVGKRHELSAGLLIGGKDVEEEAVRVGGAQAGVGGKGKSQAGCSGRRGAGPASRLAV